MYFPVEIILIFLLLPQARLQQIFERSYSTCVLVNERDNKSIEILDKLWEIRGINRHKDSVIKFSICHLSASIQGCDIGASVCNLNNEKASYNIKNAGSSFVYTKDDDGTNIFKSINGQACDENENFTTIIEFSRSSNVPVKPKFKFMSDCELRIEMMDFDFQPPCTLKLGGNLIDMRPLKNTNVEVEHLKTKRKFSMNLCTKSAKCDADVSVCELTEDGRSFAISDIGSQRVVYKNGIYSIHGHTLELSKRRRNFILTLKCNWKVNGIDKLVYLEQPQQSKKFHFSAESSLACIKLPMDCILRDSFQKNFLYDLTSLNRPTTGWNVKNVSDGAINLNMCGSLKFSDSTSECAKLYSQVCWSNPELVSLGSIQRNIQVTSRDTIITSFTDGSVCAKNATKSYVTEIEFICKSDEDGPVLNDVDECVYKIKWYTPAACAKNAPIGEQCIISDLSGSVNLQNMHREEDRTHVLAPNSHLRYNLCGPLKTPCNNNTLAGVCLVKNKKESALGITSSTLVMNDQVLVTNMKGNVCYGKTSEIRVNYRCNHMKSTDGEVQVNILRDFCDYELNVETSAACTPSSTYKCKWYNGNLLYDLSLLQLNDKNYEIRHDNYIYSLNLCRSVIKTHNAQCSAYTAVCMKNVTEMHAKRTYVSLGTASTEPTRAFEGGDLVLEFKHGQLCHHDFSDRSSRIRFKCSRNHEPPRLINKTACNYEFVWRTPSACATRVSSHKTRELSSCAFVHPTTKEIVDLTKIDTDLNFTWKNQSFNIYICGNNFTHCLEENGHNCSSMNGSVKIQSTSSGLHLIYNLFNKLCSNGTINAVNISLRCDPALTEIDLQNTVITDCIVYATLKTSHICTYTTEQKVIGSLPKVFEMRQPGTDELPDIGPCVVHELGNFDLANLKNIKVSSTLNNSYTLNFDLKDDTCDGLICRNGLSVKPKKRDCPFVQINEGDSTVRLIYKSTLKCNEDSFRTEVLLKCDSGSDIPILLKESNCTVVVLYPMQQACSWFPHLGHLVVSGADSVGVAVGSSIGVLIVLLVICGGVTFFKKRGVLKQASYNSISSDKESLQLYTKNAQD